jgi:hypothetical protein
MNGRTLLKLLDDNDRQIELDISVVNGQVCLDGQALEGIHFDLFNQNYHYNEFLSAMQKVRFPKDCLPDFDGDAVFFLLLDEIIWNGLVHNRWPPARHSLVYFPGHFGCDACPESSFRMPRTGTEVSSVDYRDVVVRSYRACHGWSLSVHLRSTTPEFQRQVIFLLLCLKRVCPRLNRDMRIMLVKYCLVQDCDPFMVWRHYDPETDDQEDCLYKFNLQSTIVHRLACKAVLAHGRTLSSMIAVSGFCRSDRRCKFCF